MHQAIDRLGGYGGGFILRCQWPSSAARPEARTMLQQARGHLEIRCNSLLSLLPRVDD